MLLPEAQPNFKIYKLYEKLIETINLENWIILYILFEINLIKELGYDSNLSKYAESAKDLNELKKISIDGYKYEVPIFLINQIIPDKLTNILIKKSLIYTRNIFQNKFFVPNNLKIPKSRIFFRKLF